MNISDNDFRPGGQHRVCVNKRSALTDFSTKPIHCPYTSLTKYYQVCTYGKIHLSHISDHLNDYLKRFSSDSCFLLSCSGHLYSQSTTGLTHALRDLFSPLGGAQVDCSNPGGVSIKGVQVFGLMMSDIYDQTHPRYIDSGFVLLLQPEDVFTKLGFTSGGERTRVSEKVSDVFASKGVRYFHHHALKTPKPLRLLLDHNGKGVHWWE